MASRFYNPPTTCQVPNLSGKWEALFGKRHDGIFVEVGAYDGESYSNTSCLADVGWGGLYIEPVPEFAEKCRQRHAANHKVTVIEMAASDVAGEADLHIGDTLTTLSEAQVADYNQIGWAKGLHQGQSRKVATERLDVILGKAAIEPGFDLLVVDVEGLEVQVFAGFTIERWRPKVVLVELEDEHPDFRDNERVRAGAIGVRQKLEQAGYKIYYRDIINSVYVDGLVYKDLPAEHMTISPRVTVGVPTHNGQRTIARALESLAAQTFRDFRVVISENASTDHTASYIQNSASKFQDIQVIRQKNILTAGENFKAVLAQCSTEYFVWLADDDWWEPRFLEACVALLDSDAAGVTAFTDFRVYYHFIDRYSDRMGYVASASHDPRLNILTRTVNMAPCAIYGVHRSHAIKAAIARLPDAFDFHDVAVTIEMAAKGQMLLSKQDLFRAGIVDEARLQRRSLDGNQIRYAPFARFLASVTRRTFGWKSAALLLPELLFQLYKVKRHNDKAHGQPSELNQASLRTRADVEAGFQPFPGASAGAGPVPGLLDVIRSAADESGVDVNTVHLYNPATRDAWVADRAASVEAGLRVLDVGAGTAPYKHLFAHCAYETHDFAQYDGYKGPEGTYTEIDYVSDITAIPVPDNSYDVILCTEVLEHVPRPVEALAEMARIVKPGGRLFLSAPLGSGLHQEPYHFYGGYTDHWYRKFLDEFGCEVEAIEPNHGWFAHLAQECARFSWTFERHKHLHGDHGAALSELMGSTLARYFYALDRKAFMREFTVGFHVTARKRLP
ncbi:FkbM family methyltransferase [Bosea psychrotolerans]|uniref:FkbM family methyltransferase n=1 Tax=Bosea psychrotolerans TaxID=1871628 RepID=A0A2S4LY29_9HYPH|nr:FkbM family methyltransferase [Bosea psychrotolerans]POR47347.1 FkbM family methyltransferase [Bosea psychrotolerans]